MFLALHADLEYFEDFGGVKINVHSNTQTTESYID